MANKKGAKKVGGRQKGTPNEITKDARLIFAAIMEKQMPDIDAALEELKDRPKDYLDCWAKLAPYFMPKKTDITSNGESIAKPIIIDFSGSNNKTDS